MCKMCLFSELWRTELDKIEDCNTSPTNSYVFHIEQLSKQDRARHYLQLMCGKQDGFVPEGSFNAVLKNVKSYMGIYCA